ncbi:MAG: hypothetical protein ACREID_08220 [Planctomycetota bacterium]
MKQLTLGFLAALAALAIAEGEGSGEGAAGPRVLVVDLEQVVDKCEEAEALINVRRKEATEKTREFQERLKKLQTELEALQKKTLNERDEKFYEELQRTARAEIDLKAELAYFKLKNGDDSARLITGLMREARSAAEAILKQRGADVVLVSKMREIQFENDEELKQEYIFRRVLAATKGVDISGEVLAEMNRRYKERVAAGGAAAPVEEPGDSR